MKKTIVLTDETKKFQDASNITHNSRDINRFD